MGIDFRTAFDEALAWIRPKFDYAATPWLLFQTVIIVCLFLAAKLVARRVEPILESRARQIKGHPGLLRVVVALLRRSNWILYGLARSTS
ncbi:hypothetical protein [Mesorhizobium sp. KR1-2]|uniref:hypothetical protein n=1 Tax=Mesorhizobium sp. KR1-2 TaxID=3156609 RepID=UPI0032B4B812